MAPMLLLRNYWTMGKDEAVCKCKIVFLINVSTFNPLDPHTCATNLPLACTSKTQTFTIHVHNLEG